MRILYIYPHPDDEAFGPAGVMAKQRRCGHEVYLLTLTRGGATKVRHELGLSIEEMGKIRKEEMEDAAKVLDLNGVTVLDFPDSGLKELDPRDLEEVVREEITRLRPHLIVSYPVHGVSGFHDHLVTHAVVKQVFCELREEIPELQRFAMTALTEESAKRNSSGPFRLSGSSPEEIDCIEEVLDEEVEINREALRCYKTYMEKITNAKVIENRERTFSFEIFGEEHTPPLTDLLEGLHPL